MVSERAGPCELRGRAVTQERNHPRPGEQGVEASTPQRRGCWPPAQGCGGVQPCPPQSDSGRRLGTHGLNQENALSKSQVHPWP